MARASAPSRKSATRPRRKSAGTRNGASSNTVDPLASYTRRYRPNVIAPVPAIRSYPTRWLVEDRFLSAILFPLEPMCRQPRLSNDLSISSKTGSLFYHLLVIAFWLIWFKKKRLIIISASSRFNQKECTFSFLLEEKVQLPSLFLHSSSFSSVFTFANRTFTVLLIALFAFRLVHLWHDLPSRHLDAWRMSTHHAVFEPFFSLCSSFIVFLSEFAFENKRKILVFVSS